MSKQPETKQDYIFQNSTESAKFVENISGWVDRNGLFFGKDERAARDGLDYLITTCLWHDAAGFCIDMIREPTHWKELLLPPKEQP